ncbi:GerMN domain-containing protein [Patescibacteria group bacterium]|nr:GerMN domain-containing protein [Patescibacteria group bacterium]
MKNKIIILLILILPLILSGCFNKAGDQQQAEPVVSYDIYTQEAVPGGGYKVKYPSTWEVAESATGKFEEFNDITTFKASDQEEIQVKIFTTDQAEALLEPYNIESESQTQIDSRLANDYLVQDLDNEGQRWHLISIINGDYLYLLMSNALGSSDFENFINDFNFLEYQEQEPATENSSNDFKIKLYFDDLNQENSDCLPHIYQEVIIQKPEVEIGLIPVAIKALIQTSSLEDLAEQNLSSAISINTRLLSFGYENNTAIVNFNNELNVGGGSCLMAMRRGQIEKTLKALNEVSGLQIKDVEIQVEGESETALQP